MHLSTVKVPIDFGLDWSWCSVSFLISNLFILPKFASHYSLALVCIYLVRPLPVSAAHSTWHRTYSFMYAECVAPWTVKQSSFISWWDHRSSMSRRLGDWHWILQAPIGSCQTIHTSHAVIYMPIFGNHRNNSKTAPISNYLVRLILGKPRFRWHPRYFCSPTGRAMGRERV